jgi:hypothetical protein
MKFPSVTDSLLLGRYTIEKLAAAEEENDSKQAKQGE